MLELQHIQTHDLEKDTATNERANDKAPAAHGVDVHKEILSQISRSQVPPPKLLLQLRESDPVLFSEVVRSLQCSLGNAGVNDLMTRLDSGSAQEPNATPGERTRLGHKSFHSAVSGQASSLFDSIFNPAKAETQQKPSIAQVVKETPTSPLPEREQFEQGFGEDLGHVKVHTGPQVDAFLKEHGAQGAAIGQHILLKDNSSPHTIAEEVAHSKQQGPITDEDLAKLDDSAISQPGDATEREAGGMADQFVAGQPLDSVRERRTPHLARQLESEQAEPAPQAPTTEGQPQEKEAVSFEGVFYESENKWGTIRLFQDGQNVKGRYSYESGGKPVKGEIKSGKVEGETLKAKYEQVNGEGDGARGSLSIELEADNKKAKLSWINDKKENQDVTIKRGEGGVRQFAGSFADQKNVWGSISLLQQGKRVNGQYHYMDKGVKFAGQIHSGSINGNTLHAEYTEKNQLNKDVYEGIITLTRANDQAPLEVSWQSFSTGKSTSTTWTPGEGSAEGQFLNRGDISAAPTQVLKQHIETLIEVVEPQYRENMRLLVTMFDQADRAALHAMYIKFAQNVGEEGAYEFYRKLWRDGMGTHEPVMQDWWSQISGLSAPEREALLELWGGGPADARAQVRAYLTSSATWEDCYKMVKELGAYALKAQQGQGEMAWGSVVDEVDWSDVLGKLDAPDMSSLETPADMQRVVDFWISGLTGYLTARELYLETAIRYHTMRALEAQSKITDESDISSAFGRALGANDQRYALSDSVAFYKRLVAEDEERLAAFKSKQDPSRVQVERWLQNDFQVIQDKIDDAKATHDELDKAPTAEAKRANIKTLQTQMSTLGERISALKEPVGSFIASGRSLLGSVERMETEIERIEAYLSRSSFDEVFDGAVAFASEFVSELAELAADAAKALINALLKQANITPEDFWKLINRMGGVVEALADDPGKFADTLIGGAKEGLDSFFGNFGDRLQKGIFGWLFKNAGISVDDIPKEFDAIGILKFGLQVMDLTWDSIKQMVAKKLGVGAQLEMVEQATAQIEEYMALGISGLVELIKEQLSPAAIGQMILDSVVDVLVENVVQKALASIASLIVPGAGALKAVKMLYDGLVWVIGHAADLVELVDTLLGSLEKVIAGDTKGVAAAVDGILTQLLPSAIGFAASLVGLGDLPKQVEGAIKKMKESIEKQLEKVVDSIVGKAKGLAKSGEGKQPEKTGAITPEEKQKHVRFANEAMNALAKVEKDGGGDYATLREAKLKQANALEKQYAPKLRKGVQMTITIPEAEEDKKDGDLDVTVKIWPNTTEKNARIKAVTQAADGTTEGAVEIPQTEDSNSPVQKFSTAIKAEPLKFSSPKHANDYISSIIDLLVEIINSREAKKEFLARFGKKPDTLDAHLKIVRGFIGADALGTTAKENAYTARDKMNEWALLENTQAALASLAKAFSGVQEHKDNTKLFAKEPEDREKPLPTQQLVSLRLNLIALIQAGQGVLSTQSIESLFPFLVRIEDAEILVGEHGPDPNTISNMVSTEFIEASLKTSLINDSLGKTFIKKESHQAPTLFKQAADEIMAFDNQFSAQNQKNATQAIEAFNNAKIQEWAGSKGTSKRFNAYKEVLDLVTADVIEVLAEPDNIGISTAQIGRLNKIKDVLRKHSDLFLFDLLETRIKSCLEKYEAVDTLEIFFKKIGTTRREVSQKIYDIGEELMNSPKIMDEFVNNLKVQFDDKMREEDYVDVQDGKNAIKSVVINISGTTILAQALLLNYRSDLGDQANNIGVVFVENIVSENGDTAQADVGAITEGGKGYFTHGLIKTSTKDDGEVIYQKQHVGAYNQHVDNIKKILQDELDALSKADDSTPPHKTLANMIRDMAQGVTPVSQQFSERIPKLRAKLRGALQTIVVTEPARNKSVSVYIAMIADLLERGTSPNDVIDLFPPVPRGAGGQESEKLREQYRSGKKTLSYIKAEGEREVDKFDQKAEQHKQEKAQRRKEAAAKGDTYKAKRLPATPNQGTFESLEREAELVKRIIEQRYSQGELTNADQLWALLQKVTKETFERKS